MTRSLYPVCRSSGTKKIHAVPLVWKTMHQKMYRTPYIFMENNPKESETFKGKLNVFFSYVFLLIF